MNFGDRIMYKDDSNEYKGVYIKDLNQVEAIIKLDESKEKTIVPKNKIKFIKNHIVYFNFL